MAMSQMCTGAGDYFKTSKPHSEKLCYVSICDSRVFSRNLFCSHFALYLAWKIW